MPQGKKYTVQDTQTGKTVTFEWNDPKEPTDTDFEEVFRSVGLRDLDDEGQQPIPRLPGRFGIGQAANEAALAAGETFNRGKQFARGGNVLAGGMNMAAGIIQGGIGPPLAGLNEAVRQVPVVGEPISDVMAIPGKLISGAWRGVFGEPQTPLEEGSTNLFESAVPLMLAGRSMGVPKQIAATRAVGKIKSANVSLMRAIPTTSRELSRPADLQRLAPYLAEEQRLRPVQLGDIAKGGKNPSVIRQLAEEKLPSVKRRIWDMQSEFISRNADVPLVRGVEPIARSIESLRNIYTKHVNKLADQSILTEAQKFRDLGRMTLSEAADMLHSLNADLQKFYKMSDEGRAAAQNAAKPIAELERAARAIREEIAKTLESRGENSDFFRKLHDDYGSALRMGVAAERNITKAESPLPPMFTERASQMYPSRSGILREVAEHTVGRLNTPDKLAMRALERYANSELRVQVPPKTRPSDIAGLLPPGATVTPPPADVSGLRQSPPPFIHYGVPSTTRALPPAMTRVENLPNPSPGTVRGGVRPQNPPGPGVGDILIPVWDPTSKTVIYLSPEKAWQWNQRFNLPL